MRRKQRILSDTLQEIIEQYDEYLQPYYDYKRGSDVPPPRGDASGHSSNAEGHMSRLWEWRRAEKNEARKRKALQCQKKTQD